MHHYDDDGRLLRTVAADLAPGLPVRRQGLPTPGRVPSGATVSGYAVLTGSTVHVPDIDGAADQFPDSYVTAQQVGWRATVTAPLRGDGKVIGGLSLFGLEARPFTEQQVALLESFADQAVIAIENARLFGALQARVGELQALGEIGQAVSSSLDLTEVLTTIVANATRLAGADGGVVYEYDEAEGIFEIRAANQVTHDLATTLQAARFHLGEGAVGRAAAARAPFQVEEVEGSDVLTSDVRDRLLARGMHSIL
jgi:GAF domain-containing protein